MLSIAFVRSVIAFTVIGMAGCNAQATQSSASPAPPPAPATASAPDQPHLCEVHEWQRDATAAACGAGQKIVFLPDHFGNEQLPILFAAVNCNLRYAVALTNGGVACIYLPSVSTPNKR